MTKEEFLMLNPDKRIHKINKMLETMQLPDIAKLLDMPQSSFSSEMQKGDYVYIKRDKKYFKFIRDEQSIKETSATLDFNNELLFIRNNIEELQRMIANQYTSNLLVLDKRICDPNAQYENKNMKINASIYKEFTTLCENQFPHLKIQDLTTQALSDFIASYAIN